ncbi:hypothetical protein EDD18DRAFT_1112013 [Armillaria luteobubalina]|uniref:MFS general substrate transporter n=1 Tax=Armillaria luteobubalina TaxID=153913 RepID=A0AA39PHJ3_9AGAR|nr:hypothetical protein EDD18DRAFT_1112013 [Armillaria luteobubalina]
MLSLAKPHEVYQFLLVQGFGMGMGVGFSEEESCSHGKCSGKCVQLSIVLGPVGGILYPISSHSSFIPFINIAFLVVANLIMKPRWLTRKHSPVDMSQILNDPPYWVMIVGIWGIFILCTFYFYLQLFSETHGVDSNFLNWMLPILNAGAPCGRFMPNFLANKYGSLNGMLWALLGIRSIAGVALFGLVYGFNSGMFLTLASPAIAAFTHSSTLDDIG